MSHRCLEVIFFHRFFYWKHFLSVCMCANVNVCVCLSINGRIYHSITTKHVIQVGPARRQIDFKYELCRSYRSRMTFLQNFIHSEIVDFSDTYLNQTFIECVSNQYKHFDVSTCQMWLHVMVHSSISLFFGYIDEHSRLNYCISTQLRKIVCLINLHILVVNMPNVTTSYRRFTLILLCFFENFLRLFLT